MSGVATISAVRARLPRVGGRVIARIRDERGAWAYTISCQNGSGSPYISWGHGESIYFDEAGMARAVAEALLAAATEAESSTLTDR